MPCLEGWNRSPDTHRCDMESAKKAKQLEDLVYGKLATETRCNQKACQSSDMEFRVQEETLIHGARTCTLQLPNMTHSLD